MPPPSRSTCGWCGSSWPTAASTIPRTPRWPPPSAGVRSPSAATPSAGSAPGSAGGSSPRSRAASPPPASTSSARTSSRAATASRWTFSGSATPPAGRCPSRATSPRSRACSGRRCWSSPSISARSSRKRGGGGGCSGRAPRRSTFPRARSSRTRRPIFTRCWRCRRRTAWGCSTTCCAPWASRDVNVVLSRIATEKGAAVDSFYLTNGNAERITDPGHMRKIQAAVPTGGRPGGSAPAAKMA